MTDADIVFAALVVALLVVILTWAGLAAYMLSTEE
jgi:hypothetical protein